MMKTKRAVLSQAQAFVLEDLPRKAIAASSDLAVLAAKQGVTEAELVMLPYLPPSPVANSNGADIHYDQVEVIRAFNAAGKWKPIDLGHALLGKDAASVPAQGWVVELAQHVKDPAHTGAWCLLTSLGKTSTQDKQYLQTSPVFRVKDVDGKTTYVPGSEHSLALTNTPACYEQLMALADGAQALIEDEREEGDEATEQAAEATTEAQAETKEAHAATAADAPATEATAELTAKPEAAAAAAEQTVALTAFTELQGQLTALTAERDGALGEVVALTEQLTTATGQVTALTASVAALTTERATLQGQVAALTAAALERDVKDAVDAFIATGKGVPSQRAFLTAAARADLAKFSADAAAAPVLPHFQRVVTTHDTKAEPVNAARSRMAAIAGVHLD